jgi:hypothetical protein
MSTLAIRVPDHFVALGCDDGLVPPATADLLDSVRRLCLALPEVTEGLTHGGETWFVRRRSFAKFVDPAKHRLDERHVALWAAAPPGARNELIAEDSRRFFVPRFGGYDWVGVRLDLQPDEPDWQEVAEILTDGYRQVAPKFLIARLD